MGYEVDLFLKVIWFEVEREKQKLQFMFKTGGQVDHDHLTLGPGYVGPSGF